MSILINKDSRVVTQGITGKTGMFHTRHSIEYANGKNCYVAGVTPKKGGQVVEGVQPSGCGQRSSGRASPRGLGAPRSTARQRPRRRGVRHHQQEERQKTAHV